MLRIPSIILMSLFCFAIGTAQTGRIKGTVVDSETGEPIVAANILIEGTARGAATDLDGVFVISSVEPASYTLVVSALSYSRQRITGLVVEADVTQTVNVVLKPEAIQAEEVVVEAQLLRNTEATLLKSRQRSANVSDAISVEKIAQTTSSTAADAIARITGASIVDNKYVFIRGLSDRYLTTQLNGVTIPSANPDRNSASLDLIPSRFIENIVTEKTFTPDKPGDFTGGSVNIETKAFPEKFVFGFSAGTSALTGVSFKDGFLSSPAGSLDWLAMDDGSRDVPAPLRDPNVDIPDIGSAFTNREKALELDRLSKSFRNVMVPATRKAPVAQNYSLSIGNQLELFEMPVGYFVSASYARSISSYQNGTTAQWNLTGSVQEVTELTNLFHFNDNRTTDEVLWGGLVSLSLKPHPHHSLTLTTNYNQTGESEARYQFGRMIDLSPGAVYETRVMRYTERSLQSGKILGEHSVPSLLGLRLDWDASFTSSDQDEPDLRFFTNDYWVFERNGVTDTLYSIRPSNYSLPVRYFRNLGEDISALNAAASVGLQELVGLRGTMKVGASYSNRTRSFRERQFTYMQSQSRYDGDPVSYFSPANVGIIDSSGGYYDFGNYIIDATDRSASYDGRMRIGAAFAMVDVQVTDWMRFIGGVRNEVTRIEVSSIDPDQEKGLVDETDLLPSAGLVYGLSKDVNIRASYGRTLGRPTFRELAPYPSFDFVGDFIFIGNPELRRTLVDNYDLRAEWYQRPGELVALSAFWKVFENPIERAIVSNNNQGQFQNVDRARVVGLEFEVRQRLDVLSDVLVPFLVGVNCTLIKSEVRIPSKEYQVIKQLNPAAPDTRDLQGQSPYIINADISYEDATSGTSVAMTYNVFGRRLSDVSLGGTPNVYELPRPALDIVVTQRVLDALSLKLSAKNLLNSSFKKVHEFNGQEFVVGEHSLGRVFSASASISL